LAHGATPKIVSFDAIPPRTMHCVREIIASFLLPMPLRKLSSENELWIRNLAAEVTQLW